MVMSPRGKLWAGRGGSFLSLGRVGESRASQTWETSASYIRFSDDDRLMAYAGDDQLIVVCTESGKGILNEIMECWDKHQVSFASDGTLVTARTGFGLGWVWDTTEGERVATLRHPDTQPVQQSVLSSSGKFAATTNWEHRAWVWDVYAEKAILDRETPGYVWRLVFIGDERCLAIGVADEGGVFVLDLLGSDKLVRIPTELNIEDLAFSNDGRYVAVLARDPYACSVWNVDRQAEVCRIFADGLPKAVAFCPNSLFVAVGSCDDKVRVARLYSGQLVAELPHPFAVSSVSFSSDGKSLAAGSGYSYGSCEDGVLRVWEVSRWW